MKRATVGGDAEERRVEAAYMEGDGEDADQRAAVSVSVDTFAYDVWCDGTIADDEVMVGLSRARAEAVAWREEKVHV